jgi:phosphotransferase system enzyme I (PtsI)/phosphotransferase system enzyme I (PtsP)
MSVLLELTRIVQAAAEAETTARQVAIIVDSILESMDVDACSLYLADPDGAMSLVASNGLNAAAVGQVKLAAGAGLVGLIATTRCPVNLADAPEHPGFLYIRETNEDQYRSFSGVPLVRAGEVSGVLVVQCRRPRMLAPEEQAFLVTLATQLALVVNAQWPAEPATAAGQLSVHGLRGAPGIGLGKIKLADDTDLSTVADAPCDDIAATIAQWHQLVEAVVDDVRNEQAALDGELSREVAAIFDAYQMLLADPSLLGGVEQAIREGHHLPVALRSVINHYASLFLAMEDPYLQARHEDIRHLGNKLYRSWRGMHQAETAEPSTEPVVLVGRQVSISDIAGLGNGKIAGIVCFLGSALSHTAVLANALGIPAVMGTGEQKCITEGQLCIVDGNVGHCIFRPTAAVTREYQRLARAEVTLREELQVLSTQPALTRDGHRIHLLANSGLLADLSPGLASGAEGLGLYRTEIPFMVSDTFPSEEEQFALYSQVLQAYAGKPVSMRILDIGGDKPLPYFPIREENPALGWRGIRFCLDNSSLLLTQLRAMLRAGVNRDNLRILLPMVSATAELTAFYVLLDQALQQLGAEGLAVWRPPVGIMVEVPAAISQLPLWREQLDFISIGTNDLSQYLLAVDRNNARVSGRYDPLHPAVLIEVARVVGICAQTGLPVSVCGEMASDPAAALLLIGLGVRTLSLSAAALPKIKWMLQHLDTTAARELAARALQMADSRDIRAAVVQELQAMGLDELLPQAEHSGPSPLRA